ncbi:unnamed protein product [Urochloa decumbens]|uniref:Uncharacterized protein n=1 Tax=Urochloa decumbens TaxID=240449 RepID=A0ABC9E9J0_9POAL
MDYMPHHDAPAAEVIGALNHHLQRRRFLLAGRVLITGGFVVVTHATIGGQGQATVNAAHAFVGFALLLLGASLVMLSPVVNQFPRAAQVGAAMADAVLIYLLASAGN